MVFENRVRKELGILPDSLLKESIFPLGMGSEEEDDDDDTVEMKAAKIQQATGSSDFVEGLDDIDKFFEETDAPEELDVGYSGSSIQEVLMGKGREILVKRVRLGVEIVKNFFKSIKSKFNKQFRDEDGNFSFDFREAAVGVWVTMSRLISRIAQFVDELIEGPEEVEEDLNFDFRQDLHDPAATFASLRPSATSDTPGN